MAVSIARRMQQIRAHLTNVPKTPQSNDPQKYSKKSETTGAQHEAPQSHRIVRVVWCHMACTARGVQITSRMYLVV